MEKYENLGLVGEGSYGIVMKCRHKATGTLVAIKKFLESEDDKIVKRIANREIKMLKQLHHENLVNLIDLFKRKKKLFLVFEFVDYTLLDDLEKNPSGLEYNYAKRILFQVLRGIEFCHNKDVIHRDIKPENILVSKAGIVKLCDFGFARPLSGQSNSFTDYVATRWYRAPELLVGDTKYGKPVDIWAIGCLTSEMFAGDPLFPGDSDIDQLFHIIKCIGLICPKHVEIFKKNALFKGLQIPESSSRHSLEKRYPKMPKEVVYFIKKCLDPTPEIRPTCSQLLTFELFPEKFSEVLISEIKMKVQKEREKNPLLKCSLNSQSPTLSKNENAYAENSNSKMQTGTTKPPVYTKSTPFYPKNISNLNFKSKLVENNQIGNNSNNNNNNNVIFKNDFSLNNQENELFSENKNFVVVDEEAWEDVRPLTSRKERVASRAGRYPNRNEDLEYHIIEPPESVAADNSQKLEIDEIPKRTSVMTNKESHSRMGASAINNTPNNLKPDTILMKINQSPRNIETPSQEHKLTKPNQAAFIQMKTIENSKLSNDRSLSNDTNVTRSSPIPTDISQSHPHYFPINSKKPIPTITNSINGNASLPLKAPINTYNSIHQPLTTNVPFNNYSVKQNSNNLQRNFGFQIDNSIHPILPNIGKDSKFRQASLLFHGISQTNKSYIPSNNNNSIFKSTSPMTNERSGLYYNASNKRRPLVNQRQNQNQEHNISLPELKGAEMPLRNQIYNTNIKYKNVIHKSNFLQSESQGNNNQMDNFTTREP